MSQISLLIPPTRTMLEHHPKPYPSRLCIITHCYKGIPECTRPYLSFQTLIIPTRLLPTRLVRHRSSRIDISVHLILRANHWSAFFILLVTCDHPFSSICCLYDGTSLASKDLILTRSMHIDLLARLRVLIVGQSSWQTPVRHITTDSRQPTRAQAPLRILPEH